jgi:hypothetical protein
MVMFACYVEVSYSARICGLSVLCTRLHRFAIAAYGRCTVLRTSIMPSGLH